MARTNYDDDEEDADVTLNPLPSVICAICGLSLLRLLSLPGLFSPVGLIARQMRITASGTNEDSVRR
jgi:hypothetical protein